MTRQDEKTQEKMRRDQTRQPQDKTTTRQGDHKTRKDVRQDKTRYGKEKHGTTPQGKIEEKKIILTQ